MSWEPYPEGQYPAVNPPLTIGFGTVFYVPGESGLIGHPGLWVITYVNVSPDGQVIGLNGDPVSYDKSTGSYVAKFNAAGTIPIGSAVFLGEVSLETVLHMAENHFRRLTSQPMPEGMKKNYIDQVERPRIENPHKDKGITLAKVP